MPISISLNNKKVSVISDQDADLADQQWYCHRDGYACRSVCGSRRTTEFLHRVVIQRVLGRPLHAYERVGHRDEDLLNNQRDNLWLKQRQRKPRGLRTTNTSGYPGVSPYHGRWRVFIRNGKKNLFLGSYKTPEEAAGVYQKAHARKVRGEPIRRQEILSSRSSSYEHVPE
jgi:hypothetical protein